MSNNIIDNYKRLGILHKLIKTDIKQYLNIQESIISVNDIEKEIKKICTKWFKLEKDKTNENIEFAFPIGIGINHVTAHWNPIYINPTNESIYSITPKYYNKDNDIIKIDIGIYNTQGNIIDSAFSYSKNEELIKLIEISEQSTQLMIKNSGNEVLLSDLGQIVEEYIKSKEIKIKNKIYQLNVIGSLCGHELKKNSLHGGKAVPNINYPIYKERMFENEIYAIDHL